MDKTEITPEGWVVADLETFRMIADHSPPRPYGYLHQLWIDCRSWKPITMWIISAGTIAVAVTIGWWPLLLAAWILLAGWFKMFRNCVQYIRESPTGVGLVEELKPHPLLQDHSTAAAIMPDGQELPVTFPTRLVDGIVDRDGRVEIFFLYDARSEFSLGLGARAVLESEERHEPFRGGEQGD